MKHWQPRIAEAVEQALAAGARTIVGLVLAPHYSRALDRGVPRPARRGASATAPSSASSRAGTTSRGFVELLAERVRDAGRARRLHRPLPAGPDPRRGRSVPESCSRPAGWSPRPQASSEWCFSFQSESPDRRAVARAGHPRPPRRAPAPGRARRARLPRRVRLRPPRDPLGHRHRGSGAGGRARASARPDRDAERRPGVRPGARGDRPARGRAAGAGMTAGCDRASTASRGASVVRAHEPRTLKELFVARGRTGARDVWALRDVSLARRAGRGGRPRSAATAPASRRCCASLAGIIRPTRAGSRSAAGSARCSSSAPASIPTSPAARTSSSTARSSGSAAPDPRALDEIVAFAELEDFIDLPVRTYSSGMYMRLGFAIAAHLDADVLLLDEVFAVGDEAFQRKCFGKIFEFKQRGGTIVFVSHDASAVERLCERAVLLRAGRGRLRRPDAGGDARYHRRSPDERDPAERGAGPARVGERRGARSRRARCSGPRATSASSSSPASRSSLRLRVDDPGRCPPPLLQLELRDDAGLLVAGESVDTGDARLGRRPGRAARCASTSPALPLADGRFHLRLGLTRRDGRPRSAPARRRARRSSSTRAATSAGLVRLKDAGGGPSSARTRSRDELPHLPRLARS